MADPRSAVHPILPTSSLQSSPKSLASAAQVVCQRLISSRRHRALGRGGSPIGIPATCLQNPPSKSEMKVFCRTKSSVFRCCSCASGYRAACAARYHIPTLTGGCLRPALLGTTHPYSDLYQTPSPLLFSPLLSSPPLSSPLLSSKCSFQRATLWRGDE